MNYILHCSTALELSDVILNKNKSYFLRHQFFVVKFSIKIMEKWGKRSAKWRVCMGISGISMGGRSPGGPP